METIFYLEAEKIQRAVSTQYAEDVFLSAKLQIRKSEEQPELVYVMVQDEQGMIDDLADWLLPYWIHSSEVSCVYSDSFLRWIGQKDLQSVWKNSWPFSEYCGYRQKKYAQMLLQEAVSVTSHDSEMLHMYVLGYEEFVPDLLQQYINNIKSLTFVIQSAGSVQALEKYLEELYEEEGLAAHNMVLPSEQTYGAFRLMCSTPAVVLDLTGDARILPQSQGGGISWIDMDALDEKRKRFEARCSGTVYFSMKERWRKRGSLFSRADLRHGTDFP